MPTCILGFSPLLLLECCTQAQNATLLEHQPSGSSGIHDSDNIVDIKKEDPDGDSDYDLDFAELSDDEAEADERDEKVVARRRIVAGINRARSLKDGRLLDEYSLGELLGQGSFGIVYACRPKREKTRNLAVKLVERVEALPEDIDREARIHQSLDHPNILKVHEVIDEKCFLCIVMDHYTGGDLVRCLQTHAKAGRRIKSGRIIHVVKQMTEAVAYLHGMSIVHRDIKADNYLLDRLAITDTECRVALADFGFSCECRAGDRLKRRCGTHCYWPPELWDRNYALKVDVWAVGVTLFGMVEGVFPFRSEWEVKHKEVKFNSSGISSKTLDLIRSCLSKLEVKRPSAAETLGHALFEEGGTEGAVESDTTDSVAVEKMAAFKDFMPNPDVYARRLELVGRLEELHKTTQTLASGSSDGCKTTRRQDGSWIQEVPSSGSKNSPVEVRASRREQSKASITTFTSEQSWDNFLETQHSTLVKNKFQVKDRLAGKLRTFEWWPRARVEREGVYSFRQSASASGDEPTASQYINAEVVRQMLEQQGVDTSLFGRGSAKTLQRFADELETGASQLMLDAQEHKALVRVVDLVLLRLTRHWGANKCYLIVSADEQLDGRIREGLNRLPGTKKRPHENVKLATERIIVDMPELTGCDIIFDFERSLVFEEQKTSPSYPGVRTVYRKNIVEGYVEDGANESMRRSQSLTARGTKFFEWLTEQECERKGVKLWPPRLGVGLSSLVTAPIGLRPKALGKYLKSNNVDPSAFGRDPKKTLRELSTELIAGESSLMVLPPGRVVRIVDVVLLRVTRKSATDDMLIVTNEVVGEDQAIGIESHVKRLPGTKRRPDENHFLAAKRVLQRQLKLGENFVTIDAATEQIVEEDKDSPSYPGLRTIYRKRVVTAQIEDDVGGDISDAGAMVKMVSHRSISSQRKRRSVYWALPE